MKNFNDSKHLDVLQNIEFGIVEIYRADRSLLDVDASDAMDALVYHYRAVESQRTPTLRPLSEPAGRVFRSVQQMCEWRLGNAPGLGQVDVIQGIPVAELVTCLRTIQKSIPRWSRQGGRKGYLDFISQYVR